MPSDTKAERDKRKGSNKRQGSPRQQATERAIKQVSKRIKRK